jgi:hypothetical protein
LIVSKLPKFASVALTHQQKKKRKEILMQRSIEAMICIGNFKKSFISLISVAKQINIVIFVITLSVGKFCAVL